MTNPRILGKAIAIVSLIFALLLVLFVYALEPTSQFHRLNSTNTSIYVEHGEAIKVTNNCGKDMFIPANTSAEWASFNASPPSCVTTDEDFIECVATPTGTGCLGSVVSGKVSGGENWENCKPWCETQNNGTCCEFRIGEDNDCELYDGAVTGSGSQSGSCTDYD